MPTWKEGVAEEVKKYPCCGLCGERFQVGSNGMYAEEVGEFWSEVKQDSVIAHAECGINAGMEMA